MWARVASIEFYPWEVDDKARDHLAALGRVLFLSDTRATDEGIALLESMPSLEHVHVKRTRVTREGLRSLKESLPNCRVDPDF